MFFSLSCRMYFRQSSVFRANRLMDFVNSFRFLVFVPEMPSSA
jgi:hypothetical protein